MAIDKVGILNRIKEIFKGLSQLEIAKICGVSQPAVNQYFKRGSLPSYDIMLKIAKYGNVSLDWILTGKGPKELSATAVRESGIFYEPTAVNIVSNAEYKKLIQYRPEIKAYIPIPLISEPVAAGDPLIVDEKDIEGFAVVSEKWVKKGHTYRCLRVRGDSMHPVISDGFIVAIDLNENDPLKLKRQIVASRYEDGVTIKYLIMTDKEYILLPHNTADYKPIWIPKTTPNPIIGKVAFWWGKAK